MFDVENFDTLLVTLSNLECIDRAIKQAEMDDSHELDQTHLQRILLQAMMDFR